MVSPIIKPTNSCISESKNLAAIASYYIAVYSLYASQETRQLATELPHLHVV